MSLATQAERASTIRRTHRSGSRCTLCSHILTARQPRLLRARSTRRSRALLAASFGTQYERRVDGAVPYRGHPCQKHPCTNMTSRALQKTKSGRTDRLPIFSGRCLRQPVTPSHRKALAKASSVERLPRERTFSITCDRFSAVQMPKTRHFLSHLHSTQCGVISALLSPSATGSRLVVPSRKSVRSTDKDSRLCASTPGPDNLEAGAAPRTKALQSGCD